MATIPQKELRNDVGAILRRAEAGERITITVSGRPVAELGPVDQRRTWVSGAALQDLWRLPPDPELAAELHSLRDGELIDPYER